MTTLPPLAAVTPRQRRNPRMIALGVLLVAVGAMVSAFLYLQSDDRQRVVVAAKPLVRGQILTAEHLQVVDTGWVPPGSVASAENLPSLVGTRAAGDLPAGAMVPIWSTSSATLPPNLVRVGVRLGVGRVPPASVTPGTMVRVVSVGKAPVERGPRRIEAKVVSDVVVQADGSSVVELELADDVSLLVATWSAHDELALIALSG